MLKITEIREQSSEELVARRRELEHELFNLRIQQKTGQLERPSLLRESRRDIARINTVLTERVHSAETTQPQTAQ